MPGVDMVSDGVRVPVRHRPTSGRRQCSQTAARRRPAPPCRQLRRFCIVGCDLHGHVRETPLFVHAEERRVSIMRHVLRPMAGLPLWAFGVWLTLLHPALADDNPPPAATAPQVEAAPLADPEPWRFNAALYGWALNI